MLTLVRIVLMVVYCVLTMYQTQCMRFNHDFGQPHKYLSHITIITPILQPMTLREAILDTIWKVIQLEKSEMHWNVDSLT